MERIDESLVGKIVTLKLDHDNQERTDELINKIKWHKVVKPAYGVIIKDESPMYEVMWPHSLHSPIVETMTINEIEQNGHRLTSEEIDKLINLPKKYELGDYGLKRVTFTTTGPGGQPAAVTFSSHLKSPEGGKRARRSRKSRKSRKARKSRKMRKSRKVHKSRRHAHR